MPDAPDDVVVYGPVRKADDGRMIYRIPHPDALTLGQMMGVRAGTGVDLLAPESRAHAMAACLWYVARGDELTWEECLEWDLEHVLLGEEADVVDPDLRPDDNEDPSSGSDSPSSG